MAVTTHSTSNPRLSTDVRARNKLSVMLEGVTSGSLNGRNLTYELRTPLPNLNSNLDIENKRRVPTEWRLLSCR